MKFKVQFVVAIICIVAGGYLVLKKAIEELDKSVGSSSADRGSSNKATPARVDLSSASLGHFEVVGSLQTWNFSKVCIQGQAYILIDGITDPNGITASFRNGVPEVCSTR